MMAAREKTRGDGKYGLGSSELHDFRLSNEIDVEKRNC